MPIHHPDLIRPIGPDERVLEVGPGAHPFARADLLCDRYARTDPAALGQDGFEARPQYPQPVLIYDGSALPFVDGAFDYLVCSHVLEHVDPAELEQFVSELTRVARGGYLEFPRYLLELQGNVEVHRWLLNVVDGEIRMLEKSRVRELVRLTSELIGRVYAQLTNHSPGYQQVYRHHAPLWVCGLQWEDRIRVRVVESWEELLEGDTSQERIPSAAAREMEELRLVPRLLAATRRRLMKPETETRQPVGEARSGLPSWLGEVVRCPACGAAALDFRIAKAVCGRCAKIYAADGLEYRLLSPVGPAG